MLLPEILAHILSYVVANIDGSFTLDSRLVCVQWNKIFCADKGFERRMKEERLLLFVKYTAMGSSGRISAVNFLSDIRSWQHNMANVHRMSISYSYTNKPSWSLIPKYPEPKTCCKWADIRPHVMKELKWGVYNGGLDRAGLLFTYGCVEDFPLSLIEKKEDSLESTILCITWSACQKKCLGPENAGKYDYVYWRRREVAERRREYRLRGCTIQ